MIKYIFPLLLALSILLTCGGGGNCQQYNPDTDQYEYVECPEELQDGNR